MLHEGATVDSIEKMRVGVQTFTSRATPALEMYAKQSKIPYDQQLENANVLHILYFPLVQYFKYQLSTL